MRIKQFYTNHKPLFQAVLGLILLIAVLIFWPRPAVIEEAEPIEPPQIKMEAPVPIEADPLTAKPSPAPTPTRHMNHLGMDSLRMRFILWQYFYLGQST